MAEEQESRWDRLFEIFESASPEARISIHKRFSALCGANFHDDVNNAMEQALHEAGFIKYPALTGASEYEMIIQGEQIWVDIQKD